MENKASVEQKSSSDSGTSSQNEEGKSSGQPEPPLPPKQPEPKQSPNLDQKAIGYYDALKDKLLFLRPPEERHVSRDRENVLRYLNLVEKLSEEEAQAIISKWEELNLIRVDVITNQIVSKDRDQEVNENGNQ